MVLFTKTYCFGDSLVSAYLSSMIENYNITVR